jgi:ABC-type spermidine/putrescine transport system permease subunit I
MELNLPYKILLLGEPMKRFDNLIKAARDLKGIEKIE